MSEIVPATKSEIAPARESEIASIIRAAVDAKLDVASLQALLAMKNAEEDRRAAAAFRMAFAKFQGECPPIKHDQSVKFTTKDGRTTHYTHASLAAIASVVNPLLWLNGLSYAWESHVDGGKMRVTCVVSHVDGHNVRADFELPAQGGTDKMSTAQQYASTLTYAKRQSLVQALGLTTTDSDLDGMNTAPLAPEGHSREPGEDPPYDNIGPGQEAEIAQLLDATKSDKARFLAYFKVKFLGDIPTARFAEAVAMLKAKAGQAKK